MKNYCLLLLDCHYIRVSNLVHFSTKITPIDFFLHCVVEVTSNCCWAGRLLTSKTHYRSSSDDYLPLVHDFPSSPYQVSPRFLVISPSITNLSLDDQYKPGLRTEQKKALIQALQLFSLQSFRQFFTQDCSHKPAYRHKSACLSISVFRLLYRWVFQLFKVGLWFLLRMEFSFLLQRSFIQSVMVLECTLAPILSPKQAFIR